MIITKPGQLNVGDKIQVTGKSKKYDSTTTVKAVLNSGDKEEILIDKSKNIYFITSMLLDGSSWTKEIKLIN
jgi:hypothetical protein